MIAIIQAHTRHDLYELFSNFKKRHTYFQVVGYQEQGPMHFLEVEFYD